jgi:hypothetical protein
MARGFDIKDTASLACHASSRPQLCLATGGWICSSCCAYGTSIREWPGLKIPIMSWWAQGAPQRQTLPRGGPGRGLSLGGGSACVTHKKSRRVTDVLLFPDRHTDVQPRRGVLAVSVKRFQRGLPATRARAAAVISESIGIPPHLSLPPFDSRRQIYLTTTNQRREKR